MVFVPALHCVEIVANYRNTVNLNVAKNVYHARKRVGGVGATDVERMATVIMPAWENAQARNDRSNQISCTGFTVRDIGTADSWVYDNVLAVPFVGATASPVMPMNVTLAFKLSTGLAGRTHRGRTYWIGLAEAQVSGDFVAGATATAITNKLLNLRTALDAEGWDLVIVSKFLNGAVREEAEVTNVTAIGAVDTRVDTQRRRLIGIGE